MSRARPLAARSLAVLALAALVLAACGRVGPIRAPGPAEAVISRRLYPYQPPAAVPAGTPTLEETPSEQGGAPISRPASPR